MISLFSFSSKLHLRNEAIPQPQNSPQIVPLCFAITQLEVCSISLSVWMMCVMRTRPTSTCCAYFRSPSPCLPLFHFSCCLCSLPFPYNFYSLFCCGCQRCCMRMLCMRCLWWMLWMCMWMWMWMLLLLLEVFMCWPHTHPHKHSIVVFVVLCALFYNTVTRPYAHTATHASLPSCPWEKLLNFGISI